VVSTRKDDVANLLDRGKLFWLHCANIGVGFRGCQLDDGPRFHKSGIVIDCDSRNLKILQGSRGLDAVVGIGGNLFLTEKIALCSGLFLRVDGTDRTQGEEGYDILRNAIDLRGERTFEQDPKYAIRLLVDIAIKALYPAINDPTTAVQALDQIEDLLVRLGRRRLEIGAFRDASGRLRVLIAFPSWEDFLRLAFDEIRFYGANSVQVMRRMMALISEMISVLPRERQYALRYWQQRLRSTIERSFGDVEDRLDALAEDRQGLGISRRGTENS
jgi:uncharacterized membrane protein